MQWYLEVLKKYAVFEGRARRKEYWMFSLFSFIVALGLAIVDGVLGLSAGGVGALGTLYSLAVLLPSIGVSIRRLHDIGHSGWWLLLIFLFCIGWIILLIWAVTDGESGTNAYGPDPKASERGRE